MRRRTQSLKASFTFSPACLRLPLAWSVSPSARRLSSPVASPACSFATPPSSSALFFALSNALNGFSSPSKGCPSASPILATAVTTALGRTAVRPGLAEPSGQHGQLRSRRQASGRTGLDKPFEPFVSKSFGQLGQGADRRSAQVLAGFPDHLDDGGKG